MKAWKKIVAAAAAGVCAISMAACGSGSSGEATDLTYDKIELGTTGKDIKTTINLFSQRTDMLQDSYNGTTWAQYIKELSCTRTSRSRSRAAPTTAMRRSPACRAATGAT